MVLLGSTIVCNLCIIINSNSRCLRIAALILYTRAVWMTETSYQTVWFLAFVRSLVAERIMACLPTNWMIQCSSILTVSRLNNVALTTTCIRVLHHLCMLNMAI